MVKKIIFAISVMILSAYAGDSFLNSCQKKWNENANAIKSFRSDMVQTFSINGHNTEESAKFLFLNSDRFYSRTDMNSQLGKIVNICRGDSIYIKVGSSKWMVEKGICAEKQPFLMASQINSKSFKFLKKSNELRVYQDSVGNRYNVDTKTCRIKEMSSKESVSIFDYEKKGNVDLLIKIDTEIKENSVKYVVELKNILLNRGVTKSFFDVGM